MRCKGRQLAARPRTLGCGVYRIALRVRGRMSRATWPQPYFACLGESHDEQLREDKRPGSTYKQIISLRDFYFIFFKVNNHISAGAAGSFLCSGTEFTCEGGITSGRAVLCVPMSSSMLEKHEPRTYVDLRSPVPDRKECANRPAAEFHLPDDWFLDRHKR